MPIVSFSKSNLDHKCKVCGETAIVNISKKGYRCAKHSEMDFIKDIYRKWGKQ